MNELIGGSRVPHDIVSLIHLPMVRPAKDENRIIKCEILKAKPVEGVAETGMLFDEQFAFWQNQLEKRDGCKRDQK